MYWLMLALALTAPLTQGQQQTGYADSYLMGKPDSPVRIEIFSDFQCPHCRAFFLDTVTSLIKEYSAGNKVAIIFREFPLAQYPASRIASRYAVASKTLGHERWAKVIEYFYTCQAEWSYDGKMEPVLARILDPGELEKVKAKVGDPAIEQSINEEVAMGEKKDVTSTPTVFVTMGGKEQRLVGGLAFPVLKQFIDPNLK